MDPRPSWLQGRNILIIAIVVFVLIMTLLWYGAVQAVKSQGNQRQQTLIARYNDTTNVLSDCVVKTKQSVGLTRAQTDALDKVITDAVRGRYSEGTTAVPGAGNNALFSAMVEAYPDLSGLSKTFDKVLIVINGCRTDFRESQTILQNNVAGFESWRTGSWRVRTFGGSNFPSKALEIKVNGKSVTGKDALAQMRNLIVVTDAQTARDSGVIENEDPFTTK